MKTILVDAVYTFVIEKDGEFQVDEKMYDLLESFPNRKIVLTNANKEESKKFNLDKLSYEVFTLAHNPEKTDPKYFEMMLEHFHLKSDDVVYFEHNPEAIKSAEAVGIKSYYYDLEEKNLNALKKFLVGNL